MADWNPRANDLFLRAAEISSPVDRAQFLDRECRVEPGLREQVESLLAVSAKLGTFLGEPVVSLGVPPSDTAACEPIGEAPGTVIGSYKLLEQIGEGGMGSVWMAQQTEPVKRVVALKVIKAGMDSKQFIARFEAERQALALMDHPNIAKVLDGGTIPSLAPLPAGGQRGEGRPYFVMDLVKGEPITKY